MKITVLQDKLVLEDLTVEEQLVISTAISCNRCESTKELESAFYCYLWERKVELDVVVNGDPCGVLLTGLDNLTCDCHTIWSILDNDYEYNEGEDRTKFYDNERLKMITDTAHRIYEQIDTLYRQIAK